MRSRLPRPQSGEFLKAAATYTKAIKSAGKDAAKDAALAPVYSNRSAAFLKLNKLKQALADADMCTEVKPDWEKGWFRKGMAHEAIASVGDDAAVQRKAAEAAYAKASELAPESKDIAAKVSGGRQKRSNKPGRVAAAAAATAASAADKFAFPEVQARAKARGDKAWATDELGRGEKAWLEAARAPSKLKGEDIAVAPEFVTSLVKAGEAVNAIGHWMGAYLELAQRQKPTNSPWFYEAPGLVQMLDLGLWQSLLDALCHVVLVIIGAESQKGSSVADAAAEAGAALAHACAGVLHNLLGPSLRAWPSRKEHSQLLVTFMKVCETENTFLTLPAGTEVPRSAEMGKFLTLAGKLLGDAEAFAALTGHAILTRVRLNILRAQTAHSRATTDADKEKWNKEATASARVLLLLLKVREAGKWETVAESLCDTESARTFHGEVTGCITQHEILANAAPKFGFTGSFGL